MFIIHRAVATGGCGGVSHPPWVQICRQNLKNQCFVGKIYEIAFCTSVGLETIAKLLLSSVPSSSVGRRMKYYEFAKGQQYLPTESLKIVFIPRLKLSLGLSLEDKTFFVHSSTSICGIYFALNFLPSKVAKYFSVIYLTLIFFLLLIGYLRNAEFESSIKEVEISLRLRNLSKTRWTARVESIRALWTSYQEVKDTLDKIKASSSFDKSTKEIAATLSLKMESADFIMSVHFYEEYFEQNKADDRGSPVRRAEYH